MVVVGATVVTGVEACVVDGAVVDAVVGATAVVGPASVEATTDDAGGEVSPESPEQAATRTAALSATRATPR